MDIAFVLLAFTSNSFYSNMFSTFSPLLSVLSLMQYCQNTTVQTAVPLCQWYTLYISKMNKRRFKTELCCNPTRTYYQTQSLPLHINCFTSTINSSTPALHNGYLTTSGLPTRREIIHQPVLKIPAGKSNCKKLLQTSYCWHSRLANNNALSMSFNSFDVASFEWSNPTEDVLLPSWTKNKV